MKRHWSLLALGLVLTACGHRQQKAVGLTVTPEAVTLIQENEERCAKIAKAGTETFRGAEAEEKRAREAAAAAAAAAERLRLARVMAHTEPPLSSDTAESPTPAPEPPPARKKLEDYLQGQAAELAVVDRAGELLAALAPKVDEEAPPATAKAVRDLLLAQQEVCRSSRTATESATELRQKVDSALKGYESAQTGLAAVFTLSAVDAQFARHKYEPFLSEARAAAQGTPVNRIAAMSPEEYAQQRREWNAVQENQASEQAQHENAVSRWRARGADGAAPLPRLSVAPSKEKSTPEALQPKMRAWHAVYAGKAAAVRQALSRYLSARNDPMQETQPVCRELLSATTALLDDPTALDAPDEAAERALKAAYGELQELARACSAGLTAESNFRLGSFERAIQNASMTLQPYALKP
ncbi:MAG TPA: hypothetical protein VGH73_10050 [Thermoanaerobaculia bacterium]|jgi:hypothetical protein